MGHHVPQKMNTCTRKTRCENRIGSTYYHSQWLLGDFVLLSPLTLGSAVRCPGPQNCKLSSGVIARIHWIIGGSCFLVTLGSLCRDKQAKSLPGRNNPETIKEISVGPQPCKHLVLEMIQIFANQMGLKIRFHCGFNIYLGNYQ